MRLSMKNKFFPHSKPLIFFWKIGLFGKSPTLRIFSFHATAQNKQVTSCLAFSSKPHLTLAVRRRPSQQVRWVPQNLVGECVAPESDMVVVVLAQHCVVDHCTQVSCAQEVGNEWVRCRDHTDR